MTHLSLSNTKEEQKQEKTGLKSYHSRKKVRFNRILIQNTTKFCQNVFCLRHAVKIMSTHSLHMHSLCMFVPLTKRYLSLLFVSEHQQKPTLHVMSNIFFIYSYRSEYHYSKYTCVMFILSCMFGYEHKKTRESLST